MQPFANQVKSNQAKC